MARLVAEYGGAAGCGGKVLYLHGWRTSADIMKMQCRDITAKYSAFVNGAHGATGSVATAVYKHRTNRTESAGL